jgi:hypothetical protein
MLFKNDSTAFKGSNRFKKSRKDRNTKFKGTDRIVTSGNYGVGDTIKVKIIKVPNNE